MVDEPEMGVRFQYKMSLKTGPVKRAKLRMNDDSHGELGTTEIGRNGGIR